MRILGLDIGTTSIGFALIDLGKSAEVGKIIRLGVRIFPEARDPDGTPLNQTRRAKRMMRRQLRRRRSRRRSLNQMLASQGLLPAFGSDAWASMFASKGQENFDPWRLRANGLTAALTPHELGRALYHLAKRRHFRERDLAEATEAELLHESQEESAAKPAKKPKTAAKSSLPDDEAKSTEARKHMVEALRASGDTLGQHLAARPTGEKKRGEHATRAIVQEEFERLLAAQAPHHSILSDPGFRGALEEAIFAQRPVFWRKSTLGKCRLMPDEPLCPKGAWISQQRVMLEKVNNLAVSGGNARPLDADERMAILAQLQTQKSMTWPGVRQALSPIFKARGESSKTLKFNLETGDEKGGLKGNAVEADLAKIFGARWDAHPHKQELRDFIPIALWQADYGEIGSQRVVIRPEKDRVSRRKALAKRLVDDFGASDAEADAITKLHFPQGWEPFSTAALQRILPQLEKGVRFGALIAGPDFAGWRDENFPQREQPTGEIMDRLPSPRADRKANHAQRDEAERVKSIRNPTVLRVQNELRKVVNNLIGHYGKPDLIRIELAREVGKSKREREEMSKGMRKKEAMRKKAREDLIANRVADPSGDDIEKWLLWKECGEQCPYTGDKIGFDDLFSGNPRFDVEHIWPRSKSLDNSLRNKTLCRKDINLLKGNRIPSGYFRGHEEEWEAAKIRIWKMVGKDGMNAGKARRFCAESMPDDFASRQLNDTSYAARQAMEFLKQLWPDVGPSGQVFVQAVTGKVTAQLRRRWGLNHVLADDGEKTRADHRHHALDALVVACADGGYTQKLSRYFEQESAYRSGKGKKPDDAIVPPPWAGICADANRAKDDIVVSHRVRKKVSGPLHKETVYGDSEIDAIRGKIAYRKFITTKKVEALTPNEIDQICDDMIREIVSGWITNHGGKPEKAFAQYPRVSEDGPEIRKVRIFVEQQLPLMARVSTGYASLSNNHHIAIYRRPDGKAEFEIVSLFEASKRLARRKPIVQRERGDGTTFVMSIALGDTVRIPSGDKAGLWVANILSANGQIFFRRAEDATGVTKWGPNPNTLLGTGAEKISVDPIGRIRPASD